MAKALDKVKENKRVTRALNVRCVHSRLADPSTLKPHPKNPHRHPEEQLKALAANIETYGWRFPVVVSNLTGRIVAGHARVKVALEHGWKVPVDEQDFETEGEELAVLASDILIPELAEIDEMAVKEIKFELQDINIELEPIGFKIENKTSNKQKELDVDLQYKIIIDCNNEQHQAETMKQLNDIGYTCKPLIT